MKHYERITIDYLNEYFIVQTKVLKKIGVTSNQIKNMIDSKLITRQSRGMYKLTTSVSDPYFELQLKYSGIVFSHLSALSLHNLTDITPDRINATVSRNYNCNYLINVVGIDVVRKSGNLYNTGLVEIISPYGNPILITNMERTLCDLVLKRNHYDARILSEAFRSYFKSPQKDLNVLIQYSKTFRVEKSIRNYMEVLL